MDSPASSPLIRIAFVLPRLSAGGAERVLITLMNNLDPDRFVCELVLVQPGGELRPLIAPHVKVHDLDATSFAKGIWPLISILRRRQPDIVVSTMFKMNIATLIAKPFLKKTAFVVREAIVPSYFFSTKAFDFHLKFLYRFLYPRAAAVISPAQKIIAEFKQLVGLKTDRHVLLLNPVDQKRIRSAPIHPLPKDSLHFVCAGRLHHQKGFDRLIRALAKFKPQHPWCVTIFGQGPEQGSLQATIDTLGLSDRVILAGLTTDAWVRMIPADAFLLPSRWEGLPNVVLESLAAGTPVISMRDAGGIEEIAALSPDGAVVITDTIEDFVSSMEKVSLRTAELPRPSLLPEDYALETVMKKFTSLMEKIYSSRGKERLRVQRTLP